MEALKKVEERYGGGAFLEKALAGVSPDKNIPLMAIEHGLMRNCRYFWFVKQDYVQTKQYLFLFGRCIELEITFFNEIESLKLWIRDAVYLLLSDNQELIYRFSKLQCEEYEKIVRGGSWVTCIQAALRDDWEFLQRQLEINKTKRLDKSQVQDIAFFEGLMEGNINKMESAISLLATKYHKQRNDEPVINELLSIPATGYAKLAWLKGYQVEIDNPLVPSEMLEVKPNESYWEYDFMTMEQFKC